MTTAFISHSTRDLDFVEQELRPFLESHGIATWVSERNVPIAVDWERKIRTALSESQWYIVVLSPDAVRSDWVQAEVHWTLEKRKGRVIPVMIKDCDPEDLHIKLLRLQFLDFRRDQATAAATLLRMLQTDSIAAEATAQERKPEEDRTVVIDLRETALHLLVIDGPQKGSRFTARVGGRCIIGRGKGADVRVLDGCVSRRHSEVSITTFDGAKHLLIADLGSANGTFVNETPITAPTVIKKAM